jgi:hypothetical protein
MLHSACTHGLVTSFRFEVYALNGETGAVSLQILPWDVQLRARRLGSATPASVLASALLTLVNNATFVANAPTTWFRRLSPASVVIVPSNAPTPSSPRSSQSRNVLIGGIVGGVCGGFVLVLALFAFIRLRRHRKHALSEAFEMTEGVGLDYVLAHEE